ncbi:metallophosphoesterase [Patulibacter minatonensis]|uniref:metallophosphoesterase n=1 Tax=Patulibacter minatonensis TaxID=298163 RepID=UPI00047B4B43|nr:metallophosphoesterase [Patulibacter minatonensis]
MRHPERTVLQLSDPHLVAEESGADVRLALALETILLSKVRPLALLLTGDLSDDGSPESYARVRAAVDPVAAELGAAVLAIPGNHDLAGPFREGMLDGEPLHRAITVDGLRIVGLDTTVPGRPHGELGAGQLEWLEDVLAKDAKHGTLLALHHPPIPTVHPMLGRIGLRDPDRLRRVVKGTDVRMMVCGHAHAVSAGTLARIPVWSAPALGVTSDPLPPEGQMRAWDDIGGLSRIDLFDDDVVATVIPLSSAPTAVYDVPVAGRLQWLDELEAGDR